MSRIASFCADHIGTHGPTSVDDLYQAAHAAGVTTARTSAGVTQALRRADRGFVQLPDGRFSCPQLLLAGATLTHRVSGDRSGDRYVWPGPELDPLRHLVRDLEEVPIEGGGACRVNEYGRETWKIPAGVLDDVAPGGLLGFTWTGTHLRVAPVGVAVSRTTPRAFEVRAVLIRHRRRALQSRQQYGYASWIATEDLSRIVLNALAETPDLLAEPVPPLDELVGISPAEAVGLLYESVSDVLDREHRLNVSLDMPEPLYATLEARASLLKVAPAELIVGLLANEMWRTAPRGTVPYEPRYGRPDGDRYLRAVPEWPDDDEWRVPES